LDSRPVLKGAAYEGFDLIYGKNIDQKIAPASIVKLLSCMVLIDNQKNLDEEFELVAGDKSSGSGNNLTEGDVITFRDALYNMLLPSSNVTAKAISRVIGEKILKRQNANSRLEFVRRMNLKAEEIGLKNSNFTNASGARSEKMHSTARDLSILGVSALYYPDIVETWSASSRVINITGRNPREIAIKSSLKNISDDDILGGKTGTLNGDDSTKNLMTLVAMPNNNFVILLTAGGRIDKHRYRDTRKIIYFINNNIRWSLDSFNKK
ncbi:unnamed protein product, partial [Ectocarpus sp. 12 AP-2014]